MSQQSLLHPQNAHSLWWFFIADDIALVAGILVFLILVSLILAFTFLGNAKQTRIAPIRDGKVQAVTSCGLVEGLVEDSAVAFRGIPYAKPPLGSLRFEHSQVIDDIDFCWNGTLKAHNSTPECLQVLNGETQGIEDCLTLDLITPEVRYINLLPVVVMIGANDFMGGSPGKLLRWWLLCRTGTYNFIFKESCDRLRDMLDPRTWFLFAHDSEWTFWDSLHLNHCQTLLVFRLPVITRFPTSYPLCNGKKKNQKLFENYKTYRRTFFSSGFKSTSDTLVAILLPWHCSAIELEQRKKNLLVRLKMFLTVRRF